MSRYKLADFWRYLKQDTIQQEGNEILSVVLAFRRKRRQFEFRFDYAKYFTEYRRDHYIRFNYGKYFSKQ